MISSGNHHFANCGLKNSSKSSFVTLSLYASFKTTQATGRSCHFSCGTAITAASNTASWAIKAFSISTDEDFRTDSYLFGEAQSRVIVSVKAKNQDIFEKLLGDDLKIPYSLLGKVTESDFTIDNKVVISTFEAQHLFNTSLGEIFS